MRRRSSDWKPIDTAPKEYPIEVFGEEHGHQWFGIGYWYQAIGGLQAWVAISYRTVPAGAAGSFRPTHWRPLSEAPR